MKQTSQSKAESKVHAITAKLKTKIDGLATRAQGQVEGKGEWVRSKVRRAIVRIERAIEK